jgi:transposase
MTKGEQARLTAWRWRVLQQATDEQNVARVCRRFGVSRKSFYKWKRRHAEHGVAGLCDRPRTPLRSPRATGREVVSKILYLRQQFRFGPARIAAYLHRFHQIAIARSSVHRILRRHGMNRLPGTRQQHPPGKRWQRYEKPVPGHRLQVDVKFLERIPGTRRRLYQFTAIDDCTRIRVLKIFDVCNQRTAIQFIDEVIRRLPFRVHVVQTDNGLPWKSSRRSFSDLTRVSTANTMRNRQAVPPTRNHTLTIVTQGRAHESPALTGLNRASYSRWKVPALSTRSRAPRRLPAKGSSRLVSSLQGSGDTRCRW